MARLIYIPNRILDMNGVSDGASVTVYRSGTTTKINLYADAGCTIPVANPYTVMAGAALPAIYFNFVGDIRVYIVTEAGEIQDEDPYVSIITTADIGSYSMAPITDRTALAALTGIADGAVRYLLESGREGIFKYSSANLTTAVTADPLQGIYVAPASAPTGASGAWVRILEALINVKAFGAAGNIIADDTAEIQAALNYLNAIGGGTLYFPEGTYKVSAYLTIYKKTKIKGAGRKDSIITTAAAGGGGASLDLSVRNGSAFYSNWTSNGSTAVDIVLEDIGLTCTNGANVGAAFYDNCGTYVQINRVTFTGFKYGVIFDQSELCDIDLCDFESQGLAGVWCVNGADLKTGNSAVFTNRISVKRCQFNQGPTAYGILDDGGYVHAYEDNNYNGCLNHIRAAGVEGLSIRGGEWESAAQDNIVSTPFKLAGGGAGGVDGGLIHGGVSSSAVGYAFLKIISGSWDVGGGALFNTNGSAAITGAANAFRLNIGHVSQGNPAERVVDGYATNTGYMQNFASAAPTTNYHYAGELVYNNAATTSGISGWHCTTSGTPGTWETLYSWTGTYSGTATFDTTGGNIFKVIDSGAAPGGAIHLRGLNGFPEVHIRPASGQKGEITFSENGVADRWSQGIKPADGNYYWSAGDQTLGNIKLTLTSGGNLTAVGALAGSNLSGTNTGDQTITLSGDVSGTGTGAITTAIGAGKVTLAMQANMATASVVYRKTAGAGAPEVQTLATLKTDLGLTGTNSGDQTITLTSDVTGTGTGSFATTIAANAVTYAKFQQVAASSLVGNSTGVLANAGGITLSSDLAFSGSSLQVGAFSGDITKAAGSLATSIGANKVTLGMLAQLAAVSLIGNATGGSATPTAITLAGGLSFSGTTITPTGGALAPASVAATGAITSSGGGIGYATGAGGVVTQATSKATGVTLNKLSGDITLNAAALAASTTVSFVFTNSTISAGDTVVLTHNATGTFGSYTLNAHGFGAGSCTIDVRNVSLGSLSEAIVIRYAVIKAVQA